MAITEGEWRVRELTSDSGEKFDCVVAAIVIGGKEYTTQVPSTKGDVKLMAAAPELARALRQLHDCAVVDDHHRHNEESRAAFARAAELLQRVGF